MSKFYYATPIFRVIIISLGILGNIISLIIFSRKTFRKNSISTYCRALAVLDCLIIIELIHMVHYIINSTNSDFSNLTDLTCKLFYYLSAQYGSIPAWILMAFSVDKMLNMQLSPPKIIKSKLFQWSVVAGIVVFHFLFYIEFLFLLRLEPAFFDPKILVCNFPFSSFFKTVIYVELTDTCLIPFVIMIATSLVTIRLLVKSRNSLERIGNAGKHRRHRDMKFAISSLTFNLFFVVLKLPFLVAFLLPLKNMVFPDIAFLLLLINCSSNFFIHFVTNSIFRRELFSSIRENFNSFSRSNVRSN